MFIYTLFHMAQIITLSELEIIPSPVAAVKQQHRESLFNLNFSSG
jgi:hypothetical protein